MEVTERTKLEMTAGRLRTIQNQVQGLCEQIAKDYRLPLPRVEIRGYVGGKLFPRYVVVLHLPEGQVFEEPWDQFPSDELTATLMLMGLK